MSKRDFLRKYFIMGSQNCERDPITILEEAAKGGITAFQFREKGNGSLSGNEKIQLGKSLREICRRNKIPFIVNDDIHLLDLLDADGIHVGQEDLPVTELREKYPNKIIGLSISNEKELTRSPIHLVDYIGAGPVYSTKSKEDAKEAVGLEWIQFLRERYPELPIVGIGGINTDNAKAVLEAGADGVSFISVVTKSNNIMKTLEQL